MMVLVDTSVWIDFLRAGEPVLSHLLETGRVATHPMIIGELACGNLQNRTDLLSLWQQLPKARHADHQEVLNSIEYQQWMGKGIGYIDAHLLASTLLTPSASLWTKDVRLSKLAQQKNKAFTL